MKIAIGSDHAGFDLKQALVKHLQEKGHKVEDFGAYDAQPSDYPLFGEKVAGAVATGEVERGILVCGNGIGMSIVANKVPGVRAALVFTEKMAQQTRSHNDSNVLSLAGRELPVEANLKMADVWLETPFSKEERHVRRVGEITDLEKKNSNQG
ncbi:MAG TPA: ribose 5-phosphate isomerase B [bacterium]|nr:ribose 5-phosphate isomerase B [bacterium]